MTVLTSALRLPQSMDELTAEWVTAALAGSYPGVEVTSLHFGTVTHATTTKVRLLLTYNDAGHAHRLPPTMLAKCGFEGHSAQLTEFARSEAVFYRDRAPELGNAVNAPKSYFAGIDETTGTAFLLLEDLLARNVSFGFALRPVTPEIAQLSVAMLARYHARWWNSPRPASFVPPGGAMIVDDWLSESNFNSLLTLPRFEYVPPEMRDRKRFRRAMLSSWESNSRGPVSLIHGDTHLGNWFFEIDGSPGILDWQGDVAGSWAHDITEYLLTALEIEDRRNHQHGLLEFYLEQLRSDGVEAPAFDAAWKQYRQNTFWAAAGALCPVAMQSEDVCIAYTQRGMAAVVDLDSLASFDD